jgi:hypothetical protein
MEFDKLHHSLPQIHFQKEEKIYKMEEINESHYLVGIPVGKKYLCWMTLNKKQNPICIFYNIINNEIQKNSYFIVNVFGIYSYCISLGSVFYGTLFEKENVFFYSLENIFYLKGTSQLHTSWKNKFINLHSVLQSIKCEKHKNKYIFMCLPLISKNKNDYQNLSYPVYSLQIYNENDNCVKSILYKNAFQSNPIITHPIQTNPIPILLIPKENPKPIPMISIPRENPKISREYPKENQKSIPREDSREKSNKTGLKLINKVRDNEYVKVKDKKQIQFCLNDFIKMQKEKNEEILNNKNEKKKNEISKEKLNKKIIFEISAKEDHDIYFLYYHHTQNKEMKFYDLACVPNYKTSLFLKQLFKKKSNYVEEENEYDDGYEIDYLLKKKVLCEYHFKFKKWVPISEINDECVITNIELFNI